MLTKDAEIVGIWINQVYEKILNECGDDGLVFWMEEWVFGKEFHGFGGCSLSDFSNRIYVE